MPAETPAGATPAVEGATPSQTTPVSPAAGAAPAAPPPPATDDDETLGEGGKGALVKERQKARDATARAETAERALADLQTAGQSETEKAIAKAKKDGATEATAAWSSKVRQSEVKSALTAAGVNPNLIDLAIRADVFSGLKVTDEGEVEGLGDAVKALRATKPDLFTKPPVPGTADGGTRGTPGLTREAIKGMTTAEINARWEEVQKALTTPG